METSSSLKSKIHVCFIARTAYPLFNPEYSTRPGATHGGAEVDLYLLAKELAKDPNYKVSFIVGDFGQPKKETYDNVDVYACFRYKPASKKPTTDKKLNAEKKQTFSYKVIEFLEKIPVVRTLVTQLLFGTKLVKVSDLHRLSNLYKKINADIYFQETAGTLTGVACFLSKVFDKKFVYRTAHDMDCDRSFIQNAKKEGLIDGYLYEWGLKHASKVITQNEGNREQLEKNFKVSSDVIKNAYYIPQKNDVSKKHILWVARSTFWKQPELFLTLAKDNPDYLFMMICPRANESKESVDWEALQKKAKAISNITFIEYVPFEKIDQYFKEALLFVNTSLYEGYPNTYVQATKNFAPIVSLTVNPDNFIDLYKCGVCANGDFEIMRKQLKDLLKREQWLSEMSHNANAYAKKEHDLEVITELYKRVFKDLVN